MSVCELMAVDSFANWVHISEGFTLAAIATYGALGNAEESMAQVTNRTA